MCSALTENSSSLKVAGFIARRSGRGIKFSNDSKYRFARSEAVSRETRKAVDEDGNEVALLKESESQIVKTVDREIEYKLRPHWYGPDGEQLTADGAGAFRNALGKRYRLVE
jgi:hypothetical protein